MVLAAAQELLGFHHQLQAQFSSSAQRHLRYLQSPIQWADQAGPSQCRGGCAAEGAQQSESGCGGSHTGMQPAPGGVWQAHDAAKLLSVAPIHMPNQKQALVESASDTDLNIHGVVS